MCPSLLAPVWGRLDDEPPVFHADRAAAEFPPGGWDRALGLGLLRELPPSNSAACGECGTGYANRVVFLPDAAGGAHPYLRCPACGPVRVDPAALRRWAVDARAVGATVLRLVGGTGVTAEVVAGRLWHLGRVRQGGRARDAYLARGVYAETRAEVTAALAGRPAAVVFVPTEAAAVRWGDTPNVVVALEAAVSLGADGLAYDPAAVEARMPAAPPGRRSARPPRKRAGPATTIERLEAELIAFL
ncbi:hypothetical protein J0H58_37545, partial [bacterium]|nr:hypothetical protein [bacterium]